MIEFLFLAEAVTKPVEPSPEAQAQRCPIQHYVVLAPFPVFGNSPEAQAQSRKLAGISEASYKKMLEQEAAAKKAADKKHAKATKAAELNAPVDCAARASQAPETEAKAEPSV